MSTHREQGFRRAPENNPQWLDIPPRRAFVIHEKAAGSLRDQSVPHEENPTDMQQPKVEDEEAKQVGKVEPKPSKQPYISFLKDFVDPVHPNYPESVHTFVSEWLEAVCSAADAGFY
ncbi:hypothetical protein BDY21DRAFT_365735 [Lineolata rhizophorae]|uniref:Uncharacterized protein n=1 Tax=Lineolata rhizophorae TaxID=578093 RepID=A0A6A6NTP8_9PEZI|nr:hypothetical protein BDY21DRAFT_365735 [Lineolata rhizophorae]